jgi:hypothetical protein
VQQGNPADAASPEPCRPDAAEGLARPSPLAALNAHIERASTAARAGGATAGAGPWPELRSAQRFRETWERLSAEVQVQQAQARAPQNAGPLNPQRLMLDTLARMGELSPHYLRRFLAHTETLLWLEQAQGHLRTPTGKGRSSATAKAARQKT